MFRVKHSRFILLSLNSYSIKSFASEVLCRLILSTLEWLNKLAQFSQVSIKQQRFLRFLCTALWLHIFQNQAVNAFSKVLISSMQWQHFLSLWYRQDFILILVSASLHLQFPSEMCITDIPQCMFCFVGCKRIIHSIVYCLSSATLPSPQIK